MERSGFAHQEIDAELVQLQLQYARDHLVLVIRHGGPHAAEEKERMTRVLDVVDGAIRELKGGEPK